MEQRNNKGNNGANKGAKHAQGGSNSNTPNTSRNQVPRQSSGGKKANTKQENGEQPQTADYMNKLGSWSNIVQKPYGQTATPQPVQQQAPQPVVVQQQQHAPVQQQQRAQAPRQKQQEYQVKETKQQQQQQQEDDHQVEVNLDKCIDDIQTQISTKLKMIDQTKQLLENLQHEVRTFSNDKDSQINKLLKEREEWVNKRQRLQQELVQIEKRVGDISSSVAHLKEEKKLKIENLLKMSSTLLN
eukprot:TRINITY_DN1172_c4_g1_i1.p1 TRINITY_DN1172_c4_g1~~TRINITY_DN1172_c4_g1_i1.p1  ORF type:complete len:243 (-),score=102.67 TRINITY_DN1172_c4_g1_i1:284-1012(-)